MFSGRLGLISTASRVGVAATLLLSGLAGVSLIPGTTQASTAKTPIGTTADQIRFTGGIPPPATVSMVSRVYHGTALAEGIASSGSTALVALILPNGTYRLVLFNASSNTSKTLQKFVPGGELLELYGIVTLGHSFLLAWENITTWKEIWEKVGPTGKISYPSVPFGNATRWVLTYGNATRVFASASYEPNLLVEFNAASLKVVANYSSVIPYNVAFERVLPFNNRLYLAGATLLPSGGTSAYFGYINLTSDALTSVSTAVTNYSRNLTAGFFTLATHGTSVYVGGALETYDTYPFDLKTDQGLFYEFLPSSSTYTNLSSLLPVRSWGVWGIAAWAKTLALSLGGFNITLNTSTAGGGIYSLSSVPRLVNQTSLLPVGYMPGVTFDAAASAGWYFSGGYNTGSGASQVGQVVAIKT